MLRRRRHRRDEDGMGMGVLLLSTLLSRRVVVIVVLCVVVIVHNFSNGVQGLLRDNLLRPISEKEETHNQKNHSIPSSAAAVVLQSTEMIYGITIAQTALGAVTAAIRFFRQTYNPKKLIIVTDSQETESFQMALQQWTDRNVLQTLFLPPNTPHGALRQAGMDQLPLQAVFLTWNNDDIRNEHLIEQQYNTMRNTLGVNAVLLNSQILQDVNRNTSIVVWGPTFDPVNLEETKGHGIAYTIMGRRLTSTPIYDVTTLRQDNAEDQFLEELRKDDVNQVYVWDNPSHWYIRLADVRKRKNNWKVPNDTETLTSVRDARILFRRPLLELFDVLFSNDTLTKQIGSSSSSSKPSSSSSSSSSSLWCAVLTGTVSPHHDVDVLSQSSSEERIESYRHSLTYWKNQTMFPHVFFVDNSKEEAGVRILQQEFDDPDGSTSSSRLHVVHAPLNNTGKNKGIGEKRAVFHAVDHTMRRPEFSSSCTNVLKVSGRFMPPLGLQEALEGCPESTKLVVQRYRHESYFPIESQIFGWPRGGIVEQLYQLWDGELFEIERFLWHIVKAVGQCDPLNSYHATSCKDICFVGPLRLPEPVKRGGNGKIVKVL